jgi:hypothetical protein
MNKGRLLLWTLIAWPLPALIAGALGWSSVWGSGSAVTDYLTPIPVAGGVLHVPTFVLGAAAILVLPNLSPAGASRLRALIIGVAIAGVLWLLNLDQLFRALQNGETFTRLQWQQNPLGLFFTCDALLALLFTAAAPQRPRLRLEILTLLLLLLPSLMPLQMAMPRAKTAEEKLLQFTAGAGDREGTRGNELLMVVTPIDINAADFRQRAMQWVEKTESMAHPRFHISAEDLAVLFTEDREAIRRFDKRQARLTLCLYEDGAPPRWLPGAGDCFSDHQSFSERLSAAAAARPPEEAPELRRYFAALELCPGEKFATVPGGQGLQVTSAFVCEGLERERMQLMPKFPDEVRLQAPVR